MSAHPGDMGLKYVVSYPCLIVLESNRDAKEPLCNSGEPSTRHFSYLRPSP